MKKIPLHIVGRGTFGTFLHGLLSPYVAFDDSADHVILAVPFESYQDVAEKFRGKHLINVCSIQSASNDLCHQYSDCMTGIHPLFGPRSPESGRTAIVTHECEKSAEIIELFECIGCEIISQLPDGRMIDGVLHDQMMAQSHATTLHFNELIQPILQEASWIPDRCLPASFLKLREFMQQFGDMSPGTVSSIKANPYFKPIYQTNIQASKHSSS